MAFTSTTVETAEITRDFITVATFQELRAACKAAELSGAGKASDLRDRLAVWLREKQTAEDGVDRSVACPECEEHGYHADGCPESDDTEPDEAPAEEPEGDVDEDVPLIPDAPTVERDPRIPAPGTVLTGKYKGEERTVTVLEDGDDGKPRFDWAGETYTSLSRIATAICNGSARNGYTFFKLGAAPGGKGQVAARRKAIQRIRKALGAWDTEEERRLVLETLLAETAARQELNPNTEQEG